MIIPDRVAHRALTRCAPGPGSCLTSTYSVASHGYAQIGWKTTDGGYKGTTAHRAAWVGANGAQIPEGMTVDHVCKNRRCVNPDHLRLLTNLENARRTDGRDWALGTCIRGHGNEHWKSKQPGRTKGYCVKCRADNQRNRRARKRGAG